MNRGKPFLCWFRHRLRFAWVSPDGYRIWRCTRCGKVKRGAMVPL